MLASKKPVRQAGFSFAEFGVDEAAAMQQDLAAGSGVTPAPATTSGTVAPGVFSPSRGGKSTAGEAAARQLTTQAAKTLGEMTELDLAGYSGASYTPARVNLSKALQAGKLRNPLGMQQKTPLWTSGAAQVRGGLGSEQSDAFGGPGGSPLTPHSGRPMTSPRPGARPGGGAGRTPRLSADRTGSGSNQTKAAGALEPQRIELPSYLNTPPRRPDGIPPTPEERISIGRRVADLEMLTFACRRANKVREEGRAFFSLGVLQDNLGHYEKAIKAYANFLKVCKECNDLQGSALAYHCLGVDYQLLGSPGRGADGAPKVAAGQKPKDGPLRKALYFHNKHRESSDSVGKFVAHLNMGITYAELGEKEASTVNHQYALRYALQLHSLEGQSLAIGNLGFSAGMYENDPEKMRILIERYVELCDTLRHGQGQTGAYQKLGSLASQQGNYELSHGYFQQAIARAKNEGDRGAEKACRIHLGIAAGQARMAEHMNAILENSLKTRESLGES